MALAALHEHVGQELHVDADVAVTLAGAAAAAVDIEAEMAGVVVPRAGLDRLGKHVADLVEDLQVGHGVAPRRAADRVLIDHDHVVDLAVAENVVAGQTGRRGVLAQPAAQGRVERVLDQRALAGAAHARHQAEQAQRKLDGDVLQVVAPRAGQADPAVIGLPPRARAHAAAAAGQVIAGKAVGRGLHLGRRALENDAAAPLARTGTDLDHVVGRADHRFFMLDDHDRVGPIAELADRFHEAIDVAGMQADRRLIEHVQHVHEARAQRRREGHPPRFAAAERADGAIEREISQPHRFEIAQPQLHLLEHHAADAAN